MAIQAMMLVGFFMFSITANADTQEAGSDVIRLSEPVIVTDTYEVFGSPLPNEGSEVRLGEVIDNSEQYVGQDVLITTRVAKVCQKKGCFFIAQDGEAVARVTFKDYEFFIPTDSGGKDVTLAGMFIRQTLSEEQVNHLAEDLGEPVAAKPFEYAIVATSVRIPKP